MQPAFRDRVEAGARLASRLRRYQGRQDVVVLALPRGGVPVGAQVAQALGAPLDVFVVRKLGLPGHEELAMGAIATGGVRVLNDEIVQGFRLPEEAIEQVTRAELAELARRERAYRGERPPLSARGKVAILVDDGAATGSTMRAAVAAVRRLEPARVVVALPTASVQAAEQLREEADEVECLTTPEPFLAVGLSYEEFGQTSDQQVRSLLEAAGSSPHARPEGARRQA